METLVAVSHHRSESYRGKRSHITNQFGSSPSRGFNGLNCRSFESGGGAGILPSPPRSFSVPAQSTNWQKRSSPIPIARKSVKNRDEGSSSPELWAGPAYCNSPPPSSLPIPTFSLRQKRSVSLDLPSEAAKEKGVMRPIAKSAPSSPTKGSMSMSPDNGFFLSNAFATQNLRRMLNLDTADD